MDSLTGTVHYEAVAVGFVMKPARHTDFTSAPVPRYVDTGADLDELRKTPTNGRRALANTNMTVGFGNGRHERRFYFFRQDLPAICVPWIFAQDFVLHAPGQVTYSMP